MAPVTDSTIPAPRRAIHAIGTVMLAFGLLGILVCFIGFAFAGHEAVDSFGRSGSPVAFWVGALVCMVLAAGGKALRTIGARGAAGSGLVLDPEQAHEDLAPWAQTGGKLVKDAIESSGIAGRQVVKVKCRGCAALNDEHAKFCGQCGAPL